MSLNGKQKKMCLTYGSDMNVLEQQKNVMFNEMLKCYVS